LFYEPNEYPDELLFTQPALKILCSLNLTTFEVTTIVGDPDATDSVDGDFSVATFTRPMGICRYGLSIFVADRDAHIVRLVELSNRTVSTFAGTKGIAGFQDGSSNTLTYPTTLALATQIVGLYIASDSNTVIRVISPDLIAGEGYIVATVTGFNEILGRTDPIRYRDTGLASDTGAFKQSVFAYSMTDQVWKLDSFYDFGNCVIKRFSASYPIPINPNSICYGKLGTDGCGGNGECVSYNTCLCNATSLGVTDTCYGKTRPVLSTIIAGKIPIPYPQSGIPTSGGVSDAAIDTPTAVTLCFGKRVISENSDLLYFNRVDPEQFDTLASLTNAHVYPHSVQESYFSQSECISISKKLNAIFSLTKELDITLVAGINGTAGDKDGIDSELNGPTHGVFAYSFLVFSDTMNHKIKMTVQDDIGFRTFTVAGNITGFRDGYGVDALFDEPRGLYFGMVYILRLCDTTNLLFRWCICIHCRLWK
jgi:hypothetical protein